MSPTVSVIVCNYNYARYVDQAIRSVQAQTYAHVQLIVVDDGSTDGSREVIQAFGLADVVFKANGGQTSGVRAGLALARGEIVMILDSDDLLLPEACAAVAAAWRAGVTLVQFQLEKRDDAGRALGRNPQGPFVRSDHRGYVLRHGMLPAAPTSGNAFATAYVRELFLSNLDRDRAYTDGYLIFTAPLYGEVAVLDRVLGVYRIHGANVSLSAGGADLKRYLNVFRTNMAHRTGLAHHAGKLGLSTKPPIAFLSPYDLRNGLYIKRLAPDAPEVAAISRAELLSRGVRAFLSFAGLSLAQRVRNIAGLLVVAAAPLSWVRRIAFGASPAA